MFGNIEIDMGVQNSVSAPSAVPCGACSTSNLVSAVFCKGCGHSLFEPCVGCTQPVLLTQKFCESCGADLVKALRSKHDDNEKKMVEAVAAAKASDFETAIGILKRIAAVEDYRFKDSADSARQAIAKIEGLRDRAIAMAQEAMAQAKQALANGNQFAVVKLLERVPRRLLSDEAHKDLQRAMAFTEELTARERELKAALAEKDWPRVGGLIDRLLDLMPKEKQYRQLGRQVSEKLIAAAKRSLTNANYAAASELVNSVPEIGRTKEFDKIRDSVEDVRWLSQQFDCEPYATPMLGRLALRFAKEVPDNQAAQSVVKKLAAKLKTDERAPRTHLPQWNGSTDCWMGGKAGMLSLPTSLDLGDQPLLRSRAGRFSVAIGLALQGLGEARTTEHFGPKKGLLGGIGRRKKNACWGVDMGSASMKAICIEKGEDGLAVIDCFYQEYEAPLCRAKLQGDKLSVIEPVVAQFLEEHEVEGIPVWGNISDSHLITRFVRLPPLKDKHVMALLKLEVEQRVPVPMDELAVA